MPTDHEYYRDLLPDYVNGKLTAHEARNVRAHMEECASCRANLNRIEAGLAAIRGQKKPDISPFYFTTVLPRVRTRLEERTSRSWMSGILVTRFVVPLAALAIVSVLLTRVPLNPASQESSLRSVVNSINSDEFADVLIGQSETQWSPTAETLSPLVSETAVSNVLAADILEHDEVNPYQSVSDLSDAEIDLLLQRLAERSIL